MAINYQDTPDIFLTKTNHIYPPNNNMVFEEFFLKKFIEDLPITDRVYLPIQWTSFYISRNYAQSNLSDLQLFLDNLPRNKKYFTIVQWDDGIINKLRDLDILILSSGGYGDYPIPLINIPYQKVNRKKDIFASFIGVINGRHSIREKMRNILANKNEYFITEKQSFSNFKETMERSIFSLCPRGYGKTSFRINESLNLGSIPVYIFDEPWIPFSDELNFEEYGILIKEDDLENIDLILKSKTENQIKELQKNGEKIYKEYFLYESCYNKIINKLKNNYEI